jgi:hypothetical protein
MLRRSFRRLDAAAADAATAAAKAADAASRTSSNKKFYADPSTKHPDLEGYVSKTSSFSSSRKRPWWIPQRIPASRTEFVRWKVNNRIWFDMEFTQRAQLFGGTAVVGIASYLFVCWLDSVSPYLALSEDPNTAFKHPYWQQQANERVARERELKTRLAASGHAGGDVKFSALDHATRAYSSQNASDRLS